MAKSGRNNSDSRSKQDKQDAAILALLTNSSVAKAAKSADVPERTLYTWLKNPDFKSRYQAERHELLNRSMGRLHNLVDKAVNRLDKILDKKKISDSAVISAIRCVIENALRIRELDDQESRLQRLEDLIHNGKGQ